MNKITHVFRVDNMYGLFLTWSLTVGNFSYLDSRLVGNWYDS